MIIRAGYGRDGKDKCFEANYEGAKAAGLHVGAYWYSYAMSVADAEQEAVRCIQTLKGKQFDFPVYFDVEEKKQFQKGKAFCDSIITTFCTALERAGYFAGLYMSTSYLHDFVSESVRKRFTIWVAQYAKACKYRGDYGIWQYSSKGRIGGIKGDVDLDEAYTNFPSIIVPRGFNGYKG